MPKALYRKWRPMVFSDVVGQPQVTDTLRKQIAGGRLSHAYLFTGTRGTGKTTCAKILAKAANCLNPNNGEPCNECEACRAINEGSAVDISEIDAASNSGVDNIRAIRDQAAYTPVELKHRVYIIDECHMLSGGAWNALLKTLEEPPEHVIFILATTELNKIPPTILSRCQRYNFRRGTARDLSNRVREIAAAEGIELTEDGAAALARLADGGFRDAISMLDQCASAHPGSTLDEDAILEELGLAGATDTLNTAKAVAEGDAAAALSVLGSLYDAGKDMAAFLSELASVFRDALILSTTKSPALLGGRYPAKALGELGLSAQMLSSMLEDVSDAQARLSRSASARLEVELCLVRLAAKAGGGILVPATAVVVEAPKTAAPTASVTPVQSTPAVKAAPNNTEDTPPWEVQTSPKSNAPVPTEESSVPWDEVPPPPEEFDSIPPVEDAPPWEEPRSDVDAAPRRSAPPERVSNEHAAPPRREAVNQTPPKQPSLSANWWQDTLLSVRSEISISSYMQLSAQPPAALNDNIVEIYVTSDFAKRIIGDVKVLGAVGRAASKVLGKTVTARCLMADERKEKDAMDELLKMQTKFDNFIVED